jgi:hypothetical protein
MRKGLLALVTAGVFVATLAFAQVETYPNIGRFDRGIEAFLSSGSSLLNGLVYYSSLDSVSGPKLTTAGTCGSSCDLTGVNQTMGQLGGPTEYSIVSGSAKYASTLATELQLSTAVADAQQWSVVGWIDQGEQIEAAAWSGYFGPVGAAGGWSLNFTAGVATVHGYAYAITT